MTFPFLSMWIIEGGRTQQSAIGGVSSASSSISVKSLGRSSTQTLSSLSTANPVTPPIFHLFGRGLGHSGSNLNLGTAGGCAQTDIHRIKNPAPAATLFISSSYDLHVDSFRIEDVKSRIQIVFRI